MDALANLFKKGNSSYLCETGPSSVNLKMSALQSVWSLVFVSSALSVVVGLKMFAAS